MGSACALTYVAATKNRPQAAAKRAVGGDNKRSLTA